MDHLARDPLGHVAILTRSGERVQRVAFLVAVPAIRVAILTRSGERVQRPG